MEIYEQLKADIIIFESEDIITASNISNVDGEDIGEDFED